MATGMATAPATKAGERARLARRLVLASLITAAIATPPSASRAEDKPGLFVNLTTDDVWAASKAVFFAHQRILKAGYKPVTIWLNIRAVYLADKRRAPARLNPETPDIHSMLRAFIADGGTVVACMACSRVAGLSKDDLIEGVVMGSPDVVLPALMGPNIRTLTW